MSNSGKFAIIVAMNGISKDKIMQFSTGIVMGLTLVCGICVAVPDYNRGQLLKRQDAELRAEIEAKKREISKLIEYQNRFKTDRDFVETIARRNRRVFPGELVFIFED